MEYIEFRANVVPLEMGRDILIAELSELGFESFVETPSGLEAYIQANEFDENEVVGLNILSHPDFKISYSTRLIEDQNWNTEWEKNFELINVNDYCVIRAPFHDPIKSITYDIIIDPKMSFGTGHHETTYLMVEKLLDLELKNKKVLDMGCGTGVLAILAKMKFASPVIAIDIDEWAYNNTVENIRNNNCSAISVQMGGAELIDGRDFDVVIANINRNVLINDMNKYVESLKKGGYLLLSGFFSSDVIMILETTAKLGMCLMDEKNKNDWILLHLIKE